MTKRNVLNKLILDKLNKLRQDHLGIIQSEFETTRGMPPMYDEAKKEWDEIISEIQHHFRKG